MATEARGYDVLVIGAGAAGMMCAAVAGERGRRVALLDHGDLPGRKILISGGGRCNFTNLHCGPERFLSENPHFAKSALAQYTPEHFLELVERYRILYHEKTLGQLFCDHSAQAILSMLLGECERGGVQITMRARDIRVERAGSGFRVECSQGTFEAAALVVATGGLSIPKLGATGFGYDVARQFGLGVVEPRPALVPLTLAGAEAGWTALAGVATRVVAQAAGSKASFDEKLLVTHRGLSGPSVLQISSYWRAGQRLTVDFAPGERVLKALHGARRDEATLRQALRERLPARLADFLVPQIQPERWTNEALEAAEKQLHEFPFHPSGTEGYAKAEVTAGGVDTRGLNSRTMEAREAPGLFFIGEAVDVTGQLGGFNFQWAWSSAVACGRAL